MKISIKKGFDVPLSGVPSGPTRPLPAPSLLALNLDSFDEIQFRVLVKVGDFVKIGQPLVENKTTPGETFVSPAGGEVREIRRGAKRRLVDIVIERGTSEDFFSHSPPDLKNTTRDQLTAFFLKSGLLPHIRMRPFDLVADPKFLPRRIFVNAVVSEPYVPSAELQLLGNEKSFRTGLKALQILTDGKLHLIYREGADSRLFFETSGVETHSARGPHPVGNASLHIHRIAPIRHPEDFVWTLSVVDVITVGKMVETGHYFTDRIIALAGDGVEEDRRGYYKGRLGLPVRSLVPDGDDHCLISGGPLTGRKVSSEDFLGFYHTSLSVIPKNIHRTFFHFLRSGRDKFSAFRSLLPRSFHAVARFTTNQHGERRPFIDGSVYSKVMPLRIPTMEMIKALLAEDFDLAQRLGLLEVAPEDFGLPAFICPSKIDMIEIVRQGLRRYSKEMGH